MHTRLACVIYTRLSHKDIQRIQKYCQPTQAKYIIIGNIIPFPKKQKQKTKTNTQHHERENKKEQKNNRKGSLK